ncbi:carbon starvation CstA family protein [Hespellia stercorisuis]|uniref:carbon starvation CstA family protein n=1 Tax=Hespellia stercorisuis TaxID=180311 RepID=UPI001FA86437|nr:carbon starvation CstA 5TM domain-containing protein [Hespellia stercorisuis]
MMRQIRRILSERRQERHRFFCIQKACQIAGSYYCGCWPFVPVYLCGLCISCFETFEGAQAQYLFPILFITVACGSISGFHSLVGYGTTSKQVNNEKDAQLIGYGAMLIEGIAYMMSSFGLKESVGVVFLTLSFSAFALTSLDTATRIARYMFQELAGKGQKEQQPFWQKTLQKPMVATLITVGAAIALLAYGYQNIWPIFGASNQLLAGMALLGLTAWLARTKRPVLPIAIPMVFMFIVTLTALFMIVRKYLAGGNFLMGGMATALLLLAVVLIAITIKAFKSREQPNKSIKKIKGMFYLG